MATAWDELPGTTVVNYFDSAEAARRYAAHRPSGHGRVLALLRSVLEEHLPVERALDAGCGTGHSTLALTPYARRIIGLDTSASMLAETEPHPQIEYRLGYAEAMPFRRGEFDLVSVSSAYHWFDHERFLAEAARVLRPGGWLVLYKAGSTGRAADAPDFERWRREVMNVRYPKVARNNEPLTTERAAGFGFVECAHETREHTRRHSLAGYVENLLTHSSVIRAIADGTEPLHLTRAWFEGELAPFFPDGTATFVHTARIHILRRQPAAGA